MKNISDKLTALRAEMAKNNINAWIIPSSDAHESEYVADYWLGREWLSGFTGSAGTLIVTTNDAALWTDGRYFIQAEQQLENSGIALMKEGQPGVPSQIQWLLDIVPENGSVGFDGASMSLIKARGMSRKLNRKNIQLQTDKDILNSIWNDRPSLPANTVFLHSDAYAGKTREDKLSEVRHAMAEKGASQLLITTLDDIAWLFNLRGSDIECNPVFLAYALITPEQATLFINDQRIEKDALAALRTSDITLKPYESIIPHLHSLPETTLQIDPATTSQGLFDALPQHVKCIEAASPSRALKAIKNDTEIARMTDCHRRDGVAMTRFIRWLEEAIPSGQLDEVNIDKKLVGFRAESEEFKGVSFPAIVGYAGHGAICHYRADDDSKYDVKPEGLLLIDSGGQYPDGTTDITRTFACGEMTDEQRRDYTLVMKCHIAMATARFRKGTRGIQLDAITRQPLWAEGLDYNHGTGHGVGYFLNVHEGPQSVSPRWFDEALKPGMLITNEPGMYRDDKHGVRLENIMLVVEDTTNEFGEFYKLKPLTLTPFDTRPLIKELLTSAEVQWINDYHARVHQELSPLLEGDDLVWLKQATVNI